jgi:ABC-type multidrug transport system ATPase subunit/CRP-like cAMP-binding protein/ABC-type multidrug transport system permease subunit
MTISTAQLKLHNAFHNVRPAILEKLLSLGKTVSCAENETFCTHGETATKINFLLDGFVRLSDSDGHTVIDLTEHQGYFGWNEYEAQYAYTATAIRGEALVFSIDHDAFESLLASNVQLRQKMFLYRIPMPAHQFFRTFNIPNFNLEQDPFLKSFSVEYFNAGDRIVSKGDEADKFYMIAHGSADVDVNDVGQTPKIVATLTRGTYFGEIALLQKTTRSATVIATEPLTVISISKAPFADFIRSAKGRFVERLLLDRINSYSTKIEDILIGTDAECKPRLESDKVAPKHVRLTRTETRNGDVEYRIRPLVNNSKYKAFVNRRLIERETIINQNDDIAVGNYKLLIDRRGGLTVQKADFHHLHVENLTYAIDQKTILDDLSFEVESGDLVAIMGPSGCGKSTLTDMIYGARKQSSGQVLYNNESLHANIEYYRALFGFVPQDDILFPELTVYENLYFTLKTRQPLIEKAEINSKIDHVLERLKLTEHKNSRVGSVEKKGLSGGQRKRVNIARELLFDPQVLFLDEPTSGLSSKDSEDIVEILKNLTDMGKMIFVVLHQPSSKIFKTFNKIVFLDKGGKLVYFGETLGCLKYMKSVVDDESPEVCPSCETTQPELIFDILEVADANGERIFSPQFWGERFKERNLFRSELSDDNSSGSTGKVRNSLTIAEHIQQFLALLHRVFLVKWNDRNNLLLSISAPIVIAALIAWIMYSSNEHGEYFFYSNKLIVIHLFVGVIFSIFLGLTNSVRDIVGEKAIYNLEQKNRLQIIWYVLSKFVVLSVIAVIQATCFTLVGNYFLEIQGVSIEFIFYLSLVSILGAAFGLFLSSIVSTSESVVNWIPIILIPQIILGGALIKFEDMSRNLYLNAEAVIPEIGQMIPSRWTHEALVVLQATKNPHDFVLDQNKFEIRRINRAIREAQETMQLSKVETLRAERKELQKVRGTISTDYPIEQYRNKTLQEAVFNGLGTYSSTKYRWIGDTDSYFEFAGLKFYEVDPNKETPTFNTPFYGELKGVRIGSTYIEGQTQYVNAFVLMAMISGALLLCIASLKIRSL